MRTTFIAFAILLILGMIQVKVGRCSVRNETQRYCKLKATQSKDVAMKM